MLSRPSNTAPVLLVACIPDAAVVAALGRPLFNNCRQSGSRYRGKHHDYLCARTLPADAILEAIEAGIGLVVCITDGIPIRDMLVVRRYMVGKNVILLGPNCPLA